MVSKKKLMQFCLFLSLVFSIDLISILTLFQTYIIQIQCSDGTTGKCNCIYREGNSLKSNTTDTGWTGERCEIPPSLGTYSCLNQNCKKRVGKGAEERGGNLTIGIIRAKNVKDMDTLLGTSNLSRRFQYGIVTFTCRKYYRDIKGK